MTVRTEIMDYLSTLHKHITITFSNLQKHSPMFTYIFQPDIKESYKIDISYFKFLNTEYLDLKLIEFINSEIWKLKFTNGRDEIMKNEDNYLDIITKT